MPPSEAHTKFMPRVTGHSGQSVEASLVGILTIVPKLWRRADSNSGASSVEVVTICTSVGSEGASVAMVWESFCFGLHNLKCGMSIISNVVGGGGAGDVVVEWLQCRRPQVNNDSNMDGTLDRVSLLSSLSVSAGNT